MDNFVNKELDKTLIDSAKKVEDVKDVLLISEGEKNSKNREFLTRLNLNSSIQEALKIKTLHDTKVAYLEKGFKTLSRDEFVTFIEKMRVHADLTIVRADEYKGSLRAEDIEKLKSLDNLEYLSFNKLYVIFQKGKNNMKLNKYILVYLSSSHSNVGLFSEEPRYIIPAVTENALNFTRFKVSRFYKVVTPLMLLLALFSSSSILYFIFLMITSIYVIASVKEYIDHGCTDWKDSHSLRKYYHKTNLFKS